MPETRASSGVASPSPSPASVSSDAWSAGGDPPDVSVADVLACDSVRWYPAFEKVALPSLILPLPAPVLAYLRDASSLVVPQECQAEMNHTHHDRHSEDDEEDEAEDDQGAPRARRARRAPRASRWPPGWSSSDEDVSAECPTFPDFTRLIRTSLARLGGQAFCKLNWSAPRDAAWLALGHSLRCEQASQIYLLLKGSDLVGHDLHRPFEQCSEPPEQHVGVAYALILKPWLDINPGHEFRAFVRHGRLVGVSQRDVSAFFDHLDADRANILGDIRSFFGEYIQSRFPAAHYTFDVVRSTKDRVQLLDFAPWGGVTDPLLFDWHELASLPPDAQPRFRSIPTAAGIQPNGMRQYALPRDLVDLATGQDPLKLMDFLQLQTRADRPGSPDDEQV